jgi:hypothetical protein
MMAVNITSMETESKIMFVLNAHFQHVYYYRAMRGRRGRDRMVDGCTTTVSIYAISAQHR